MIEATRALAMEEAARVIRALAPVPSGLVAVDRKLLEDARASICHEHCGGAWHNSTCAALMEALK